MFVTYAPNREDVVLWRALGHVRAGTYVDVGAADPTIGSVTRAFYERGWSGINIEPVEARAAALRAERPRDTTFAVAAGAANGMVRLHVAIDAPLPRSRDTYLDAIPAGDLDETQDVAVRTLTDLISEAGLRPQPVHFLRVDVDDGKAEVITGLDLTVVRPWVLVVAATEPISGIPSDNWETSLVEAGYSRTLFDGLNHFYVATEHSELTRPLSYAACALDEPYLTRADEARERKLSELTAALRETRSTASQWRSDLLRAEVHLARVDAERRRLDDREHELQLRIEQLHKHVAAMEQTLSWRMTRPARMLRSRQFARSDRDVPTSATPATSNPITARPCEAAGSLSIEVGHTTAFVRRVDEVVGLLNPQHERGGSIGDALEALERVADDRAARVDAIAWLGHVAATGAYPLPAECAETARRLRQGGGRSLTRRMEQLFVDAVTAGEGSGDLEVIADQVLIDLTYTISRDLHTGIQRVARECTTTWLQHDDATLVHWNRGGCSLRRLDDREHERLRRWHDHMYEPGSVLSHRVPDEASRAAIIPWNCTLLIPEMTDPARSEGLLALATASVLRDLSVVGFDLIPVTAAEYVTDDMSSEFCRYLSLVKHATRLSAISESSADDFRAFNRSLRSQGLFGPTVTAAPLPAVSLPIDDGELCATHRAFRLSSAPLVLVVGSHEPRKNHLAVLEAADELWNAGFDFDLLFVGGATWGRPDFANYIDELTRLGRPVQVRQRVGEGELWALYHLATFTVFPSFVEGYGLPIAESLVTGTPAITTHYGSMAEVAKGGGALTIDPRDPRSLRRAMQQLLADEELLADLRAEAAARAWPTWQEYASRLWDDLVIHPTRPGGHQAQ